LKAEKNQVEWGYGHFKFSSHRRERCIHGIYISCPMRPSCFGIWASKGDARKA
jgi:hypothetical protein